MGLIKKDDATFVELATQIKLLREDVEKLKLSCHTMTKHLKFLVHTVKLVNPNLQEEE